MVASRRGQRQRRRSCKSRTASGSAARSAALRIEPAEDARRHVANGMVAPVRGKRDPMGAVAWFKGSQMKKSGLLAGCVLGAVLLSGCTGDKEASLASCKLDLQRYSIRLGEQGLYLENCMRAAGYKHAAAENSYDTESYRTELEEFVAWLFPRGYEETRAIDPGAQAQLAKCQAEVDRQHLSWERGADGKMPAFNYVADCMETTGYHYDPPLNPQLHCADGDDRCDMLDAQNWAGRRS
jgi:hypothetical protein